MAREARTMTITSNEQKHGDSIDLTGFVDLHIHTGPDVRPRKMDDIDTAKAAAEAGLKAILIKSHVTITADRATIAERIVPGIRVFGSIALNHEVGGLNVAAVETALKLGAAEVWMPTFSARGRAGTPGGIVVVDEAGKLLPAALDVIKLVAEKDAILGTGHVSVPEIVTVVREARRLGVRKVMVTHPDGNIIDMPVEVQQELAALGAFFERTYESAISNHDLGVAGMARHIREVGPGSTVITSDMGQPDNPTPVKGFRQYIAGLVEHGITWDEIRLMAGSNPAALLGV
jgi:hypothetical protein